MSNLYPTEQTPGGGVFISKRVQALRMAGVEVAVLGIRPSLKGIARGAAATLAQIGKPITGSECEDVPIELTLREMVLLKRNRLPKGVVEKAADAIEDVIEIANFDLIHAHGMYMLPAGGVAGTLARRSGLPHVVSLHGSDINLFMPGRERAYGQILKEPHAISFVSTALRQRFYELGGSNTQTHVIPNGIDPSIFRSSRFAERRPHVSFIGSLSAVKGADRLPEVFRLILRRVPEATFSIVGDGKLRTVIERQLAGLPVEFLGTLPQEGVADVMRLSSVVVMPSRNEGWPCVVLEAHACGATVIGTNVGGFAEANGDPQSGVDEGPDVEQRLAQACARALKKAPETQEKMRRAARFSWDEVATQELRMYCDVVQGRWLS